LCFSRADSSFAKPRSSRPTALRTPIENQNRTSSLRTSQQIPVHNDGCPDRYRRARTILAPEAVQKVGLSKIDETTLIRVGGEVKADVYAASLQFPHSGFSTIEMIAVPCCELVHPLFRCLIGRDVLSRWVFTYDGPVGTWQISEAAVSSWVEPPEGSDLWGE